MKGNIVVIVAVAIVAAATLCTGATFRWMHATDGYQEYTYEKTSVDNSKVPGAIVGERYAYSDQYLITYKKGSWPYVNKQKLFVDRTIINASTGERFGPVPKKGR